LVEGVARFIEQRARQEVQLFVVEQLRELVEPRVTRNDNQPCDRGVDRDPRIAMFLPAVCQALRAMDSIERGASWAPLREAFEADIRRLPRRLALSNLVCIDSTHCEEAHRVGRLAFVFAAALTETFDITIAAESLLRDQELNHLLTEVQRRVLRLYGAFAIGLAEDARDALTEQVVMGLIQTFAPSQTNDRPQELWSLARQTLRTMQMIHHDHDVARSRAVDSTASGGERPLLAGIPSTLDRYVDLFEIVIRIGSTDTLANQVLADLGRLLRGFQRNDIPQMVATALRLVATSDSGLNESGEQGILLRLIRVVSFGATLVSANTPEEVSAAVESFATPVGSWRLKRHTRTVFVNAYVGGMASLDFPMGDRALAVGPHLSLGVEWTIIPRGLVPANDPRNNWPVSMYLGAVDLSGFLSQPVTSGPDRPAFDPLSLLSPSLYLHMGLGNSPFALGVGVQYVVHGYQRENDNLSYFRTGLVLAVDVPLLRLW